jgi:plastocyanin
MRKGKWSAIGVVLVVAGLGVLAPAVLAGQDGSATVRFGNDDVGSPFPPIMDHDQSGNGKFNLIPRTVTIAAGGNVTYDIFVRFGIHQPVVYEAGTRPDDVEPQGPFPFVNDPEGQLAIGPAVNAATGTGTWTTPAGTFDDPGRYLVLCNFAPHFAEFGMYGWVNVK